MKFEKKDILGIKDLSVDEIIHFGKQPNLFWKFPPEKSRKCDTPRQNNHQFILRSQHPDANIFEIAGKRLSADTINISSSTSSVVKGEPLSTQPAI